MCAASPGTRPHGHHPGTFRGIIEKIGYLKRLGITAVELMPVTEFNENEPPLSIRRPASA
jgi:pullulanase/glycogen debranching enzyme